jgi:hypothetical protein
MRCNWFPGDSGDHAPINESHPSDQALMHEIYSSAENAQKREIKIDYMNWVSADPVWKRRHSSN